MFGGGKIVASCFRSLGPNHQTPGRDVTPYHFHRDVMIGVQVGPHDGSRSVSPIATPHRLGDWASCGWVLGWNPGHAARSYLTTIRGYQGRSAGGAPRRFQVCISYPGPTKVRRWGELWVGPWLEPRSYSPYLPSHQKYKIRD